MRVISQRAPVPLGVLLRHNNPCGNGSGDWCAALAVVAFFTQSCERCPPSSVSLQEPPARVPLEVEHPDPCATQVRIRSVKKIGETLNWDQPRTFGPNCHAHLMTEVSGGSAQTVHTLGKFLMRWTSRRSASLMSAMNANGTEVNLCDWDYPVGAMVNRRQFSIDVVQEPSPGHFVWLFETSVCFSEMPEGEVTIRYDADAVREHGRRRQSVGWPGDCVLCPPTTLIMPVPTPNVPIQSGAGIAAP